MKVGRRVLVCFDGSAGSERAVTLVRSVRWPERTTIRLFAVLPEVLDPALDALLQETDAARTRFQRMMQDAAGGIAAASIEHAVEEGRAASAIVAEAKRWEADLVVAGSRGHGPIEAVLLGSVAAEVVDHAPCPVLVARSGRVRASIVAEDGSNGAATARATLIAFPGLAGDSVCVTSVVHVAAPASSGITATVRETARAEHAKEVAAAWKDCETVSDRAAAALEAAGIPASTAVREGDPAHEILGQAQDLGADLIVLGSRGRTGLARVLLGSVARNVLLHAPMSVLVARAAVGKQ